MNEYNVEGQIFFTLIPSSHWLAQGPALAHLSIPFYIYTTFFTHGLLFCLEDGASRFSQNALPDYIVSHTRR
jgi:hypothetical protein